MVKVAVRPATRDDAQSVARMWNDFARYLRDLGDTDEQNFSIEKYLRDGFGDDPAFSGFIAERDSNPVGYLLYHFGYDVDQATRVVHIVDLWVDPGARRGGVARALMCAAAERGRAKGATEMIWSVFAPNKLAADFYERLGARFHEELRFMHMPVGALPR
jgi:ribosomal protein S18 acetylase RimI-like enzyme